LTEIYRSELPGVGDVKNQAQLMSGPLENRIEYIISIGTGVISLKPFQGRYFYIAEMFITIATDIEQMAEKPCHLERKACKGRAETTREIRRGGSTTY
jgi:hypothetical protein